MKFLDGFERVSPFRRHMEETLINICKLLLLLLLLYSLQIFLLSFACLCFTYEETDSVDSDTNRMSLSAISTYHIAFCCFICTNCADINRSVLTTQFCVFWQCCLLVCYNIDFRLCCALLNVTVNCF
jgi:hypothetical protein